MSFDPYLHPGPLGREYTRTFLHVSPASTALVRAALDEFNRKHLDIICNEALRVMRWHQDMFQYEHERRSQEGTETVRG